MATELYDAYGRKADLTRLKEEQAGPTLGGVRNIYSTLHPERDLTPEKLTSILQVAEYGDPYLYLELAEAMEEKDLHYLSVIGTRKHAIAALDFTVMAASQSKEDLMARDLVNEQLLEGELDLPSAVTDQLDALGKGFSVLEIIWDGIEQWWPRQLKWRDPRWFAFDWISGEQTLVRTLKTEGQNVGGPGTMNFLVRDTSSGQQIGIQPATAPLEPFRFCTHFAKAKAGLPIRGGLARAAAYSYLFKNYILKDWVTFAEAYGQPLRLGKYGPGASAQDKQQLLNAVMNIGTDCAAIIPESMMIEFIKADMNASTELFERFLEYTDKQVSKAVLGQTMTSDVPKSGGLGGAGAAKVHDMVRHDIADDDARKLAKTWNRDLVKPIVDINLGPRRSYPQIMIGFPDEENLEMLGKSLSVFVDRGLRVKQQEIAAKFGIELGKEDDDILHPVTKATEQLTPPGAPTDTDDSGEAGTAARPTEDARFAARRGDRSGQDAIDRFTEKLRDESDEAMRPIIEPLLEEMALATSYEDLKHRSTESVKKMFLGKFQELLARAGFKINLAGNLGLRVTDPTPRAAQIARKQTPRQ
jgi:phage gp29-like protein